MRTLVNSVLRYGEELHTPEVSRKLETLENEMMRRIFKQRRENHPRNDVLRALGGTRQMSLSSKVARLINKVRIARNDDSFAHSFSENAELCNSKVTQRCNIATQYEQDILGRGMTEITSMTQISSIIDDLVRQKCCHLRHVTRPLT